MRRVLAVAAVVALAAPAHAQEAWPQRPVTIVVPFAAGGSADLLARILQQHLQARFGVPFVVDNKSGAGGSIGTGFVAKAPADGYTLLVGTVSSIAINAFLYTKLNFDVARDPNRCPCWCGFQTFCSSIPRCRRSRCRSSSTTSRPARPTTARPASARHRTFRR